MRGGFHTSGPRWPIEQRVIKDLLGMDPLMADQMGFVPIRLAEPSGAWAKRSAFETDGPSPVQSLICAWSLGLAFVGKLKPP